jgi:redox-sensitive bicupin YhaK (pirin superfamily)
MESIMKKVISVHKAPQRHWVGDGFPVHGMFGYNDLGQELSPFLLLDYAAPTSFAPNDGPPRGVGSHPHRGFETVTIVYDGEVEHRDSAGHGGVIGPGDVQWMTAAGGILHQEFHSAAYSRKGGPFEMVQLWVNLPIKDKMTTPGYQGIVDADIPVVTLPDGAGRLRVIAGELDGRRGPAHTFTPMNVWDVRLAPGATVELPQPAGWTTAVVVLSGDVTINGTAAGPAQLVRLSREGGGVGLVASAGNAGEAKLLLLAGEPIDEPVVGYGPFVMNSEREIVEAINDFNSGRFGRMA